VALDCMNITLGGGTATVTSRVVYADPTQTNTDITTALGLAGGAHNSTPEITTIQTDVAAMVAVTGDVHIVWDTTRCTTKNQMRTALRTALAMVDAVTTLTG